MLVADSMDTLQASCAIHALKLQAIPLHAIFQKRTCTSSGRIDVAQNSLMLPFLTNVDLALEHVLSKLSSTLLAGQNLAMMDPKSDGFAYVITKVVVGVISGHTSI